MGKKSGKVACVICRRCGRRSYHKSKKVCSHCRFGKSSKLRSYAWLKKKRRKQKKR